MMNPKVIKIKPKKNYILNLMKQLIFVTQIIILLSTQHVWAQPTKADTIHVSHYNINLEIRDFVQQEIKGYTDVAVEAKIAPLASIYLHFQTLTVDSVKNGNNSIGFSHQGMQLKIDLPFLSVGETKTIRVYYHGTPQKDSQWGGFYFTSDFAYNMGVGMGSYPHSFGRVWFPCIDEFTDKSTYTFNITTDADKKAVCGGILTDSIPENDGICWKWELTDPIPSYLASVAVSDYQVYRDTIHSISGEILPIEIYANPATIEKVPGTFVNLKTFVHIYEKRWGICRWQRVGYVAVPFGNGAMEHATNIAFPQNSISGTANSSNQNLIAHELAHSWFGNLITCSTSQNMWINEGFATYGALLCDEILDPTLQKYKTEIRSLHFGVLRNEKGLYALNNVPPSATYGNISYDKGGLVAYTLRNYMGDDLYFAAITQFLDENQYSNVNSEQFFQQLSNISEMNLYDFYSGWVNQPGMLNFNIDSIKPVAGSSHKYELSWKQKLYYAQNFADHNKIDVEFISEYGERYLIENISFSGEQEFVSVELPFEPVFWCIDPNGKIGDACFDYTQQIDKTGLTSLSDGYFRIDVTEISDTSVIRVEHNPVPPTPAKNNQPDIIKISEKHFWRIGFLQYNNMNATYSFTYDKNKYEGELMQGYTTHDLVLLYRKDASYDWQIIPAKDTIINTNTGRLSVNYILPGEYTFGIGNNINIKEWDNNIVIYPNPTTGELTINNEQLAINNVEIFDIYGRNLTPLVSEPSRTIVLDISHSPTGIYFVKIEIANEMIIKKIVKL